MLIESFVECVLQFLDLLEDEKFRLALERRHAGDHLVEHTTKRPEVGSITSDAPREHLGTDILSGADEAAPLAWDWLFTGSTRDII